MHNSGEIASTSSQSSTSIMNGVANWVGVGGVPVRVGEGVGGTVRVQVDIGVGVDMLVGKTGVCEGI